MPRTKKRYEVVRQQTSNGLFPAQPENGLKEGERYIFWGSKENTKLGRKDEKHRIKLTNLHLVCLRVIIDWFFAELQRDINKWVLHLNNTASGKNDEKLINGKLANLIKWYRSTIINNQASIKDVPAMDIFNWVLPLVGKSQEALNTEFNKKNHKMLSLLAKKVITPEQFLDCEDMEDEIIEFNQVGLARLCGMSLDEMNVEKFDTHAKTIAPKKTKK